MLCVLILSIIKGTYSLKSTSNNSLVEKLFMQFYLLSEEILFVFYFDVWPGAQVLVFTFNNTFSDSQAGIKSLSGFVNNS